MLWSYSKGRRVEHLNCLLDEISCFQEMDSCRFCLVVCFLCLLNIGLVENFDFDVCTSKRKVIQVSYMSNGALMPLNIECGQTYLLKDVTSIPTIRFAAAEKVAKLICLSINKVSVHNLDLCSENVYNVHVHSRPISQID